MNSFVGEKYTVELITLFEQQGTGLYNGQHSLCLTLPCLHYLQQKFSTLQEGSGDPVSAQFPSLQQLQDNLARILSLKLIPDKAIPLPSTATLNVEPFRSLQTIVLKKVPLRLVTGLQRLRGQLKTLVVQRCHVDVSMNSRLLDNIDNVIVHCCGDESTSFAWNSLKELDLSNNSISKLGDSLQYLPCLEKANFSNNSIGPTPFPSSSLTGSLNSVEQSHTATVPTAATPTATATIATVSVSSAHDDTISYTEGIECIDSVTSLHLGFNNLQCVPKFGPRAKYNLRILNLRNNRLDNINGIRELDRLVELDLTDNLLSKHMALEPLKNLHHLSILILQGNPLAYHPKHRIKTTKHLSNLINRNNFRLDGKKLSAAEKKVISSSLTHYPAIPPAFSPVSSLNCSLSHPLPITTNHQSPFENDQAAASSMPNPEHLTGNVRVAFTSMPNTPQERDSTLDSRKWQEAAKLVKDDAPVAVPDDSDNVVGGGKTKSKSKKKEEHTTAGNSLLGNSQELDNYKHVRKEMQESWLKTNPNPVIVSSSSTTDDASSTASHSTVQPPVSDATSQPPQGNGATHEKPTLSRSSSLKKSRRKRNTRHNSKDESLKKGSRRSKKTPVDEKPPLSDSVDESGGYGPRASSPVLLPSSDDGGECFLVERYESDMEEEGGTSSSSSSPKKQVKGEKQLMLVISERFLEEKSSMGDKFMDRWDLNTLQQASVEKKPWKSSYQSSGSTDSQLYDVLSLQFNLERRDRSRREYVLLEDQEVSEALLSLLTPIIEHNKETLSLTNRVECLACQHVFDVSQAFEQPSDEPQPLKSSFAGRRRSLSKLLCPFCSSPILQYSSVARKVPSSYSPGHVGSTSGAEMKDAESPRKVVVSESNVQSGFSVDGSCDVDGSRVEGSSLIDETPQKSRDLGSSSVERKRESPLVNGFGEKEELLETLSGEKIDTKSPTKENQRNSEPALDDLSPWKKPKPTSLPLSATKLSTNPFDGLEDDHVQETPRSMPSSGANVPSTSDVMQNGVQDGGSHDQGRDVHGAGAGLPKGGAAGKNPFEDSSGKNPFDDFGYEDEEPNTAPEIPEQPQGRSRSDAISDAFTRRSADLGVLSPMLESPGAEGSMSVPAQYHIHHYMSQAHRDGRKRVSSRDDSLLYERSKHAEERHPLQAHNVTPPLMRRQHNRSPLSSRKLYKDQGSGLNSHRNLSGSAHGIDSIGRGQKWSSLDRNVKLRLAGTSRGRDGEGKRYSSPITIGDILSKYSPSSPRRTPTSGQQRSSSGSRGGSRRNSGSLRGSSEGDGAMKGSSPLPLYKDDDPSYIHNNLNLYLDMEIFNNDKAEHFKMVFKSPVMQYGHKLEIPALTVVSSYKFYIFKITAPESATSQQWLERIAVHHLKKLVYIDHGVGHQYLRVEFSSENACYTFLVRNDKKCTICATMLAHIVTDVPKSSFRTVGVVPFTVDSIRYPDRVLREVIMTRYDKIKTIRSGSTPTSSPGPSLRLHRHINLDSRPSSTTSMGDDDELVMYRLVRRVIPGDRSREEAEVKMTLVLTEQAIYLGKENFAQWPLPKVQELPKREELKPPFSKVRRKSINDVEQIILDRDKSAHISLFFFKELNEVSIGGMDDRKWMLKMHSAACVNKVVETIKSRWEAQFETTLPVLRK